MKRTAQEDLFSCGIARVSVSLLERLGLKFFDAIILSSVSSSSTIDYNYYYSKNDEHHRGALSNPQQQQQQQQQPSRMTTTTTTTLPQSRDDTRGEKEKGANNKKEEASVLLQQPRAEKEEEENDENTSTRIICFMRSAQRAVLQVIPNDDNNNICANKKSVLLLLQVHGLLYDFLLEAAATAAAAEVAVTANDAPSVPRRPPPSLTVEAFPSTTATVASMGPPPPQQQLQDGHEKKKNDDDDDEKNCQQWIVEPCGAAERAPMGTIVVLHCLYADFDLQLSSPLPRNDPDNDNNDDDNNDMMFENDHNFAQDHLHLLVAALEDRVVCQGTSILLATIQGLVLAIVEQIILPTMTTSSSANANEEAKGDNTPPRTVAFHLGTRDSFSVRATASPHMGILPQNHQQQQQHLDHASWQQQPAACCHGYQDLERNLLQLLQYVGPGRPSGVLLTGPNGVGKTRLAASVARAYTSLGTAGKGSARTNLSCNVNSTATRRIVHWVSLRDLLLQASFATESDLLDAFLAPLGGGTQRCDYNATTGRPEPDERGLLVIDDLQVLASADGSGDAGDDDGSNAIVADPEQRLLVSSLVRSMDWCVAQGIALLGIGQSDVPSSLAKFGRLETRVAMETPTQRQREAILSHLLATEAGVNVDEATQWAAWLSPVTGGCLAADLKRLCTNALTSAVARAVVEEPEGAVDDDHCYAGRDDNFKGPLITAPTWEDVRRAAQALVPSQLASLDVIKPPLSFLEECPVDDWIGIHEQSWRPLAGYASVKKRIYRTVVVPWRRFELAQADLRNTDETSSVDLSGMIAPPSGVLFHGPSGCGKTVAATCLGGSLGLPMVKIRAADVLDKWLGGSEAAVRSLFSRARSAAPCILFLDEIDAIASNRAAEDGDSTNVMSRLLSTLLNEMDGVSSSRTCRVLVVACTNRLESLDAALLRPGRLEEHVYMAPPSDVEEVRNILDLYLAKAPLQRTMDLQTVSNRLLAKGWTGADVEGVAREAVLQALRRVTENGNHDDVEVREDDFYAAGFLKVKRDIRGD